MYSITDASDFLFLIYFTTYLFLFQKKKYKIRHYLWDGMSELYIIDWLLYIYIYISSHWGQQVETVSSLNAIFILSLLGVDISVHFYIYICYFIHKFSIAYITMRMQKVTSIMCSDSIPVMCEVSKIYLVSI